MGWGRHCYNSTNTHPTLARARTHTHTHIQGGKTCCASAGGRGSCVPEPDNCSRATESRKSLPCGPLLHLLPARKNSVQPNSRHPFFPSVTGLSSSAAVWSPRCVQLYRDPVDCSLPGSCSSGILQARILAWAAIPFSRGSCQPGDWTGISC